MRIQTLVIWLILWMSEIFQPKYKNYGLVYQSNLRFRVVFFMEYYTVSFNKWRTFSSIGLITCFPEGLHITELPFSPFIYTFYLDEWRPLLQLLVVHFACITIYLVPGCCKVSTLYQLSQLVLKTGHFRYAEASHQSE